MKKIKKIVAAIAAGIMAIAGTTMSASAAESDYYEQLVPLFYAPYATVHTSDSVNVKLRTDSGTMMFNTSISITGSGQVKAHSLTSNNTLTLTHSGNYSLHFVGSKAGTWKTVYYSLSNYGNYSSINVSGNVSN